MNPAHIPSPLITAEDLATRLGQVHVIDCTHDLMQPEFGWQAYLQGHVPGAQHAHLDRDLSGPHAPGLGRHPLPAPDALARWLGARGIRQGDAVVAYDRSGGSYAARLWWMLRWIGQAEVRVLDGGWAAWIEAQGAVEMGAPAVAPSAVSWGQPQPALGSCVDTAFIRENLLQRTALVVDARGAERFEGRVEPIDPRAGHIPGAVNRPLTGNLEGSGRFKPAEVLREEWLALLGPWQATQVVSQCGSGVTACHNLLSLEVAGLTGARLYPGSWSAWCSDAGNPIATGPV